LRARIDLGFGHPTACDAVVAALELKALTSFNNTWFERQIERLKSTPPGLMFSGLAGDFEKLLDPKVADECLQMLVGSDKTSCSDEP
jgi:hypothetical protein